MTSDSSHPIPKPDMKHCYRCGLDYPGSLQHPLEECQNRFHEQNPEIPRNMWPPALETKELEMKLRVSDEDHKRMFMGEWTTSD